MLDDKLFKNIVTLAHFETLQHNGKSPILGVFRGRSLVVISHKADGALEKLGEFIKRLACCALERLGFLSTNLSLIEPLKDRVYAYHYGQVKKHQNCELNALQRKLKQKLAQEISVLVHERDLLASEKKTLSTSLKELIYEKNQQQHNLDSISADYANAKNVLLQLQETEKAVVNLKEQKDLLEDDVREIEQDKNRLMPLKAELDEARSELNRVKSDTRQNDFKQQVDRLKYNKVQLENDNDRLQKEVNSIRTHCRKCYFPTRW